MKEIIQKINELKEEKNAIVVSHHYAPREIHKVSDILGDSRGVYEKVKGVDADIIVAVMPYFFAEIIKALHIDKKVLVPIKSECPVANHSTLSFEKVNEFKKKYPNIPLVCYTTSPFETKILADALAFPGEVVKVIENFDSEKALFVGERNCSEEVLMKSTKNVIVYPQNPVCNVYSSATIDDVERIKNEYGDFCLMVHPECRREILEVADYVCGTGEMYELIKNTNYDVYVLGVEEGFYQRVKEEFKDKKIIHLSKFLICNAFKVFRLRDVLNSLAYLKEEVVVDETIAKRLKELFEKL